MNLAIVSKNQRIRPEHAAAIHAAWQKGALSVIETGDALLQAKAELEHGDFMDMVANDLPFEARTAQRLMAIAAHPILSNTTHVSLLPASWGTLYALSRLPSDVLTARIEDRTINPKLERRQVALIYSRPKKRKKKRGRGRPIEIVRTDTRHDRDLEFLRAAWDSACETAREAFLTELRERENGQSSSKE